MKTKEELENKLMLIGFSGLAYTSIWNETAKLNNLTKHNINQVEDNF